MNTALRIGTCSWNYESWVGLLYSRSSPGAAGYLGEYSRRFRTAEIDSWFYRLPERRDVIAYLEQVDADFRFTAKVTETISLTHHRNRGRGTPETNPDFLSPEVFLRYVERVRPMLPQTDALMLEFEYLNRGKMPSPGHFLRALDDFIVVLQAEGVSIGAHAGTTADAGAGTDTDERAALQAPASAFQSTAGSDVAVPVRLPLAIETRNKNYLTREYFEFLKSRNLIHVFSEKLYMPPVYEVCEQFGDLLVDSTVIRLLGGDRAEIEKKTGNQWNRIVDPRPDKGMVASMIRGLLAEGRTVSLDINNHYEGSAPLSAEFFEEELKNPSAS
jgi:uncharacterized protein YecE (DUF72 family)